MNFLRSLCLLALSWYSINCAMDAIPKIEFKGTITDFKKHFEDCEFTKEVDEAQNFENYLFELAFKKGDLQF